MPLLQKISTVFWRARVTSELTFILVMNLAFLAIISLPLNLRLFCWQAAVKLLESDMVSYGTCLFWKQLCSPSLVTNGIPGLKSWQN